MNISKFNKKEFDFTYRRGFYPSEWKILFGEIPEDGSTLPSEYEATEGLWNRNRAFSRSIARKMYGVGFNYEIGLAYSWADNDFLDQINFDAYINTRSAIILLADGVPVGFICTIPNSNGPSVYWNEADEELIDLYNQSVLHRIAQPRDGKTILDILGW